MKRILASIILAVLPAIGAASGGAGPALDHFSADLHDKASLQRGVALVTNYCMGCHSLKYSRYDRIATDLGIPVELYEQNLIFNGAKAGELMDIAMKPSLAKAWFGAPPPDLTLAARLRGGDWLYTYLRGFYQDASRPFGVNNAIFPAVGMPHVLNGLQGLCAHQPIMGAEVEVDPLSGRLIDKGGCKEYATQGSMTPEQYDAAVYDMVNFLTYVAEPNQLERRQLGIYVLLFLSILFVFAYLLNREYWKDIH